MYEIHEEGINKSILIRWKIKINAGWKVSSNLIGESNRNSASNRFIWKSRTSNRYNNKIHQCHEKNQKIVLIREIE